MGIKFLTSCTAVAGVNAFAKLYVLTSNSSSSILHSTIMGVVINMNAKYKDLEVVVGCSALCFN